MAQRKRKRRESETDEEWFEQLRRDPEVLVHNRKTHDPFVPVIRVTQPVDVIKLIGRESDETESTITDPSQT